MMFYPASYDRCCDWEHYVNMAEGKLAMAPYCYRPLTPWLASLFGDVELGFWVVNTIAAAVASLAFYLWARELTEKATAFLALLLWLLTAHHPFPQAAREVGINAFSSAVILLGFLAVEKKSFLWAMMLAVIGGMTRDACILIGAYAIFRNGWWHQAIAGAVTYLAVVLTATPMPTPWIHSTTPYFLSALAGNIRNPLNLTAGLWYAWGPFGFLALYYFKTWPKNFKLLGLVMLVFVLCGGLSREEFLNWIPFPILIAAWAIMKKPHVLVPTIATLLIYLVWTNVPATDQLGWARNFSSTQYWPTKAVATALGLSYLAWIWRTDV